MHLFEKIQNLSKGLKTPCFLLGNKSGNRRTANIRSIGHSDLFSLSKEDLTDVLSEFPAAKTLLEEKGRQILTKMGMLEENGEGQAEEAEKADTKIKRLENKLEILQTKLARLMVELESSNSKMQARVEQLELEVAALSQQLECREEGKRAQGRGEGVGGEVGWEREEAEGEEQEGLDAKVQKQRQREDGNDVTKEGDGESTKSTKENVERMVDEGPKDADDQVEKKNEGEKKEKGDNRLGKGDGAEIEPEEEKEEKGEGVESGEGRGRAEEDSEKGKM